MTDVPIVLVVRHPDAENNFTVQGQARVIDIDLGSSFDASRLTHDDAEAVTEAVQHWRSKVADLAQDSPVRSQVERLCAQLMEEVTPSSTEHGDVSEPYLWLQDDEDEATSDDGSVRLVASHQGSGPAVFLNPAAPRPVDSNSPPKISAGTRGMTVHFSRPSDDYDGPTLGPYDWLEVTYQSLKVAPDGDEIAFFEDAWVLVGEADSPAQTFSDITFAPAGPSDATQAGPDGR